jgi:hypothetical protein
MPSILSGHETAQSKIGLKLLERPCPQESISQHNKLSSGERRCHFGATAEEFSLMASLARSGHRHDAMESGIGACATTVLRPFRLAA